MDVGAKKMMLLQRQAAQDKSGQRAVPSQVNKPGLVQRTIGALQLRQPPLAPPAYRPQPVPKVLQTKAAVAPQPPSSSPHIRGPVAPSLRHSRHVPDAHQKNMV